MPFAFKRIDLEDSESRSPDIFAGSIKIGSAENCDLVIRENDILPFHCEIYHVANEYKFAAADSAFVLINDREIEIMPAILKDADVVSIGKGRYKFHIIQRLAKRSWKAGFASYLALFFFLLMILFEIAIVIWLPYKLGKQNGFDIATMRQDIYRTLDELRPMTENIITSQDKANSSNLKAVLSSTEDQIAAYLRKCGDEMNWEQTRTVYRDIYSLKSIVTSLEKYQDKYYRKLTIDPNTYINSIVNKFEKQTDQKANTRETE